MKEKIITVTKLAVPAVVILSIAYEWSYFYGLGISLSQTPLSSSDFLKGWIRWYPIAFGFLTGLFLIKVLIPRLEHWKTEEEIIQSSKNPEATRRDRLLPWRIAQFFSLFLLLFPILFGEAYATLGSMGLGYLWARFMVWLFRKAPWESFDLDALLYGGLAIVSILLIGFQSGASTLNTKLIGSSPSYKISSESSATPIVRSFDQWTLVRVSENEFSWIQHDSNAIINFKSERQPFRGLACSYFNTYPCREN